MDTGLSLPAVAYIDDQTNLADDSDEVALKKIWRWLEAIHEREPPEEQSMFNDYWVLDQEYRYELFKETQQRLVLDQAEKDLTKADQFSSSESKPSLSYGRVQIHRRSPTSGSNGEPNTDVKTHFQPAMGNGDVKAPLDSLCQGTVECSDQSKRGKTFAERAKNLGSPASLYLPGERASNWVRRIRANSRTATQRFFKHTN